MKEKLIIFAVGIILGFIISILMVRKLQKPCDPEIFIQEVPVPEPYPVHVPVPEPVWVDTANIWEAALATIDSSYIQSLVKIDTAEILSQIDTMAILVDYYSIYHYEQSISDDSTFAVDLYQEISQNRIIDQNAIFRPLKKDVHYITVPKAMHYIYVGGMITAGPSPSIAPMINYSNDRGNYGAGYDPYTKSVMIQAQIKLFSCH